MWAASKLGMAELSLSGGKYLAERDLKNYVAGFERGVDGHSYAARVGGIDRYEKGRWAREIAPSCLYSEKIRAISQDMRGAWWVAFRHAAPVQRLSFEQGTWRCENFGPEQGLIGAETHSLFVDTNGVIWRGHLGGYQAGRYSGEKVIWDSVTSDTGLSPGAATELGHFAIKEAGGFWLATTGGISRISGAEHLFNSSAVPPPFIAEIREPTHIHFRTDRSETVPDLTKSSEYLIGRAIHGPFLTPERMEWTTDASKGIWHRISQGRLFSKDLPSSAQILKIRYAGATSETIVNLRRAAVLPQPAPAAEVSTRYWLSADVAIIALALLGTFVFRGRTSSLYPNTTTRTLRDFDPSELQTIPPGTLLRDRYKIKDRIAIGGFAQLFLAVDTTDNTEVAVKRIHTEWYGKTEKSRHWLNRRFAQEVAAMSMLHHPSIIKVLDSWIDDEGAPYLVTPFIHAPTLRQFLQERPDTPLPVSIDLIGQLAEALSVSHHQGVVHCEVKPENILIDTNPDGTRRVILIDFGTSALRFHGSTLSGLTRPAGSIHYMAPEQLLGRYSTASDVYSLSITAFEILIQTRVAELPIAPDGDLADALGAWAITQPEPLPALWPHFAAALAFDPRQRPDNPRVWAAGLIAAASSPGSTPGEANL